MTNSIENKAKFLAQYWGQNLFVDPMGCNVSGLDVFRLTWMNGVTALLKPLSSCSDENAIELSMLIYGDEFDSVDLGREIAQEHDRKDLLTQSSCALAVDRLRCMGYALPWNGVSVEEQIKYGWVKLMES